MFVSKLIPPTPPLPLQVKLNQDQLNKTTFQTLHSPTSNQPSTLSSVQDLYLVKDLFSLPSQLSFTYHQALNLLFSEESEEDFGFQNSVSLEEVEGFKELDTPLVLDLDKETDTSFQEDDLYLEDNQEADEENPLSQTEENDNLTLSKPSYTFEEQEDKEEPRENQNEENSDNLDDLESPPSSPANVSQENPVSTDVSFSSFDKTSCLHLLRDQSEPLSTSTKDVALQFEEDMSGYLLNIKQDHSIQTLKLKGSIQSLSFQDDQVVLTLFNDQNEPLSSWTVYYQPFQEGQNNQPFVQVPIQDQTTLTSTTLVAPIIVDDHSTPFAVSAVQTIPSQGKLMFDSGYEPLVIENQEEISKSFLAPAFSSPVALASISSSSRLDSPSSLSSSVIQPTSPISTLSTTSLSPSISDLSSLSPTFSSPANSSALVSPSLPLETTSASLTPSILPSSSLKTDPQQMPALDQLAYPPVDLLDSASFSLSLTSSKPETLSSSDQQVEKKTSSPLLKPLVKELQQQAAKPLATVQQAGQSLSQGNTLYVKDPSEVQVHVENGTLQEIKVFSKDSRKTYTSLEMAMEAEKQATFEMEANLKSSHSDQISQAKWTIIPLGETIEQSISLPAQDIKAFYTLENNGKLSSYRQPSKLSNALLCRGFEPLETQSVYPGESLRVYVEEEGDYTLSVNGKHQNVSLQQDELGQSYIPVSVGALKTDITLEKDGATIYSQSLQTNNPMVRLGWIAPVIGSLVGIILDVRRRKWL